MPVETWIVELATDAVGCNRIEMEAETIVKVDYYTIYVDGIEWKLPQNIGLSFAEISKSIDKMKNTEKRLIEKIQLIQRRAVKDCQPYYDELAKLKAMETRPSILFSVEDFAEISRKYD